MRSTIADHPDEMRFRSRTAIARACGGSARALALVTGLVLAGCSGGGDTMTQPLLPAPAADLDTSRAPPQTVTSTPLLPPMPEDRSAPPAAPGTSPASAEPMQYDHLYSDDEQVQIQSDLTSAAARALKN